MSNNSSYHLLSTHHVPGTLLIQLYLLSAYCEPDIILVSDIAMNKTDKRLLLWSLHFISQVLLHRSPHKYLINISYYP